MGDLYGDYAPKYEMVIFISNGERKLNGRRDSNIIRAKRTGNNNHPTEKPINLMEYLINKSTEKGDLVLDTFAGGGSTLIAAKRLERNFIGIELDSDYCRIINDRLEKEAQQIRLF
jgi:site-specific DNA-methyltransferase (adenine-specific)